MNNLTISVFGNQTFSDIAKELKILNNFKFINYEDFDLCINDAKKHNHIVVFFRFEPNNKMYEKIQQYNIPYVVICNSKKERFNKELNFLIAPFKILDFEKKIVSLIAKFEYRKNSFIFLNNYIIDKNERKIRKNNIELKLSEKEVNFLILFSKNKGPLSKQTVLKKVWKYSSDSETHTVETHIHRLRKKILEKFSDKNFIKNDSRGYYI